jgi:hypothetical protein
VGLMFSQAINFQAVDRFCREAVDSGRLQLVAGFISEVSSGKEADCERVRNYCRKCSNMYMSRFM